MSVCIEKPGQVRLRLKIRRIDAALRKVTAGVLSSGTALVLFLLALPIMLPALLFGRLVREARIGLRGKSFPEYTLVGRDGSPLRVIGYWPRLWNIVRGDVALVGPEMRRDQALDLTRESNRRIASVQPGLVSTWWIRQRTNVAYTTQTEADLEYVDSKSAKTDVGIALRAALAAAYGGQGGHFERVPEILGLPMDNMTLMEAVNATLEPSETVRQISFINVDCVNKSVTDHDYRRILRESNLRLADGIGLRIAGKILREEIRQNVNGTDMFPVLCDEMQKRGMKLFLLGGRPGVAEDVAKWIAKRLSADVVAGFRDGYFKRSDEPEIVERINQSGADVLLVAMGAPLQEKWIERNRASLRVRSALGVGGLFDFYSGRVSRAPQWLREIGFEWTWRLIQEPGRMWRRYLVGNVVFLARVMWTKAFGKSRYGTHQGATSL
jgi:N-acetylglucosaminyldiphosphoundecaprenol N-acetyl-beta-D-mannosaminyltransferase